MHRPSPQQLKTSTSDLSNDVSVFENTTEMNPSTWLTRVTLTHQALEIPHVSCFAVPLYECQIAYPFSHYGQLSLTEDSLVPHSHLLPLKFWLHLLSSAHHSGLLAPSAHHAGQFVLSSKAGCMVSSEYHSVAWMWHLFLSRISQHVHTSM